MEDYNITNEHARKFINKSNESAVRGVIHFIIYSAGLATGILVTLFAKGDI